MAFFAAFLSRALVWSCCRPVSPAGTHTGPGGSPHPGAGTDFSEQRRSAGGSASFLDLFFFDSSWHEVRTTPWGQNKGEQRHRCSVLALGRGYCPQWQCLLLALISARSVKSPVACARPCLFLCLPSCHPGNINKFASRRISGPHFFSTCAKFSLVAVFPAHPVISKGWLLLASTGFNRLTPELN